MQTIQKHRISSDGSFSLLIRESTLDQLLVEEFALSAEFASWFLRCVTRRIHQNVRVLHAAQSVVSDGRETDVEVLYQLSDGVRLMLLVENKILAAMQPYQLEDYRSRGDRKVKAGICDQVLVVLCAPAVRIREQGEVSADAVVSHEDIRDYFMAEQSVRGAFRAEVFRRSIEKKRGRAVSDADNEVSAFWVKYLARAAASEFNFWSNPPSKGQSGRPSGSHIIYLRTAILPPAVMVPHKWRRCEVELQLPKAGPMRDEARILFATALPSDWKIVVSGASLAVRARVPRVLPWEPLDDQLESIEAGIQMAEALTRWFIGHINQWRPLLERLGPPWTRWN